MPPESLHTAVSLNSAGFNLARVVGPAAAGALLLVPDGAAVCFGLEHPLVRAAADRAPAGCRPPAPARAPAAATVRGGVAHAYARPALRRLLTGCAIFTFCAAPLTILVPAYADALGGGPDALGGLLGRVRAGAMVSALFVVRLSRRVGRSRVISCAMLGYAVVGAIAALAPSPLLAALPCALAGACWLAIRNRTKQT